MTILLTGATGFIGSEVARQLAVAGQPTRVMVRSSIVHYLQGASGALEGKSLRSGWPT